MAEQEGAQPARRINPSTRKATSEGAPPLDPLTLAQDLKLELDTLRAWEESGGPPLDIVWDTLRSGTPTPRHAAAEHPPADRLARARTVRAHQKAAEGTAADPLVRARAAAARLRDLSS